MTGLNTRGYPGCLDPSHGRSESRSLSRQAIGIVIQGIALEPGFLARNKARIVFPWQLYYFARFFTFLPSGLVTRLLSMGPGK